MRKIKITDMRKTRYDDLIEKYEKTIEHACAFHKADFTYHKKQICRGDQCVARGRTQFAPTEKDRECEISLPFFTRLTGKA